MIPVVVLAAGASSRMGRDKLRAVVAGRPLLAWTLSPARCGAPLVVVTRADDLYEDLTGPDVRAVPGTGGHGGMAHSIATGLRPLGDAFPGAAVVLGDDPIAALELPAVLAEASRRPQGVVAVRRANRVPHPVYVPRAMWPLVEGLAREQADHGMRDLLGGASTTWIAPAPHAPVPVDVDTEDDIPALEAALRSLMSANDDAVRSERE